MSKRQRPTLEVQVQQSLKSALDGNAAAAAKLERAYETHPDKPPVLAAMGVLEMSRDRGAAALGYLREARQRGFQDKRYLLSQLVNAAALAGDTDAMAGYWDELRPLAEDPQKRSEFLRAVVQRAYRGGHRETVERALDLWRDEAPESYERVLVEAQWLAECGRKEDARNLFRTLNERNTEDPRQLALTGLLAQQLGAAHAETFLDAAWSCAAEAETGTLQILARLASRLKRYQTEIELLDRIVARSPDLDLKLLYERLDVWQKACQWQAVADHLPRYLAAVRAGQLTPKSLWRHLSLPGLGDADQQDLARAFMRRHPPPTEAAPTFSRPPREGRRLRVGFLSADFKKHPVAQLLMEVMERYDRSRFEFVAYDNTDAPDSYWRNRILGAFDRVVRVQELSDQQLIETVRGEAVDVLMEMQGSTTDSRFLLLRHRLAPVQIGWLGFLGTVAGGVNDYILADPHTIPDASKPYFDEHVLRLPDFCFPSDTRRTPPVAPPRVVEGLPEEAIVYCSFNAHYKINPDTFGIWMDVLKDVETSVLWLVNIHPESTAALKEAAEEHGVSADRLIFAEKKDHTEHLGRLQLADVALDTWPHNSGATGIDTLWAGVPMVTFAGRTMESRVASGMVHSLGMPDLCREGPDDYKRYAIQLGMDPDLRGHLRQRLIEARDSAPLYQPVRFTRHLERALDMAYARFEAGEGPADIDVPVIDAPETDAERTDALPIEVLLERGQYYLGKDEKDAAKRLFEAALEREPENARALYGTGMVAGLKGDYPRSLRLLQAAVGADPENKHYEHHLEKMKTKASENWHAEVQALMDAGFGAHKRGQFADAMAKYRQILERSPDHPRALHYLGLAEVQQHDAAGLDKMRKSLELQPHDEDFLFNFQKAQALFGQKGTTRDE